LIVSMWRSFWSVNRVQLQTTEAIIAQK